MEDFLRFVVTLTALAILTIVGLAMSYDNKEPVKKEIEILST